MDYKKAEKEHREIAEIASSAIGKLEEVSIDDYTASMLYLANSPLFNPPFSNMKENIEKLVVQYTLFKEVFKLNTFGEVREALKKGKIDKKAIEYWIEEESIMDFGAIIEGYPQYKERINELSKKYDILKEILTNTAKKAESRELNKLNHSNEIRKQIKGLKKKFKEPDKDI